MLYMAQLEDKIKVEQEARQRLAEAYDLSLNTGFNVLNDETKLLSHNPLLNEVVINKFDSHRWALCLDISEFKDLTKLLKIIIIY